VVSPPFNSVTHLKAEHLWLGWLPYFSIGLLALQLVLRSTGKIGQKSIAGLAMLLPVGLMATVWTLVFFVW